MTYLPTACKMPLENHTSLQYHRFRLKRQVLLWRPQFLVYITLWDPFKLSLTGSSNNNKHNTLP